MSWQERELPTLQTNVKPPQPDFGPLTPQTVLDIKSIISIVTSNLQLRSFILKFNMFTNDILEFSLNSFCLSSMNLISKLVTLVLDVHYKSINSNPLNSDPIVEILKCSILGPQNLGSRVGAWIPGSAIDLCINTNLQ